MDPERNRIRQMVGDELPGHAVVFEDDDEDNNIRFLIKDSSGTVVTRGMPAFHRGEIRKWSDRDLRALIRFVCGGKPVQ
jgi:hypothetical protein